MNATNKDSIVARCLRCKRDQDITDYTIVYTNERRRMAGVCPECGCGVSRFISSSTSRLPSVAAKKSPPRMVKRRKAAAPVASPQSCNTTIVIRSPEVKKRTVFRGFHSPKVSVGRKRKPKATAKFNCSCSTK